MRSELCIHDIATGETSVLLTHEGIIEAPNWHGPAEALVVNGGGRLWMVSLWAPRLEEIDTGPHRMCNNDHGMSEGGMNLWFSDKTETGKSCIYRMSPGKSPDEREIRRVTEKVPSWWHSWSSSLDRIAYAGVRDGGPVAIYTCAYDGGDERLVTDAFDHADGPGFTPDGGWIWFNGEREGRVDLWRIRPDGTELERMTHGDTVDWFPHPSPDGSLVLFLAYPPGTQGHPANLDVALRVMSAEGGENREVVRLLGGQGTINVPCWAPDARRFAFMRFAP